MFGNGLKKGLGLLLDINEERFVLTNLMSFPFVLYFAFRSLGSSYTSQSDGL